MARPLPPQPLNNPAIKRRTFFCGFPLTLIFRKGIRSDTHMYTYTPPFHYSLTFQADITHQKNIVKEFLLCHFQTRFLFCLHWQLVPTGCLLKVLVRHMSPNVSPKPLHSKQFSTNSNHLNIVHFKIPPSSLI